MTAQDVGAELLNEVIANPADDAPRLIYADWLDSQGDASSTARSEYIRLACWLVENERPRCHNCNPPTYEGCPNRKKWVRLLMLIKTHWRHWAKDVLLASGIGPSTPIYTGSEMQFFQVGLDQERANYTCFWRRGFLSLITCDLYLWLAIGPDLVRLMPLDRGGMVPFIKLYDLDSEVRLVSDAVQALAVMRHSPFVPDAIFQYLVGGTKETDNAIMYPSFFAAREAISTAAIAWAKDQQPHPPLPDTRGQSVQPK